MAAATLQNARMAAISMLNISLHALAWLAVMCYVLYAVFAQTGSWSWDADSVWTKMRDVLLIQYTMDDIEYPQLISGWETVSVTFTLLPIAVASIAVTAAVWLAPSRSTTTRTTARTSANNWSRPLRSLWVQIKQACAWQLPPHGFWLRWCEGLTALEAFLVVGWAIMHVVVLHDMTSYYYKIIDAWEASGLYLNAPRSIYRLEYIALAWGWLMWPNLMLLFCPISHNSFLNYMTGLPYSAFVRFHRWIGHFTMITLTLHALFYYLSWLTVPELGFWEQALDWNTKSTINFLAGSIAWLFGLVLWLTALEWVRRRFFEVFYKCHLVCFLGFLIFGMIHFWWNWLVFAPGLALYCADLVLRTCQAQNLSVLTLAGYAGQADGPVKDGDVVAFRIPLAKDAAISAGQDLYLLAPSISRWQWHPFTIAAVQEEDVSTIKVSALDDSKDVAHGTNTGPRSATVYIKAAGAWTQELLVQALKGPVPVRIIGPFGAINMQHYAESDVLLLIAGGIGVAPVLAILSELVAARAAGAASIPSRVRLLWVARHSEEFAVLDEGLARAASEDEDWLSLSLHCTTLKAKSGSVTEPKPVSHKAAATDKVAAPASATPPATGGSCPIPMLTQQVARAGGTVLQAARSASGFFWGALRPMQPQALGAAEREVQLYRCVVLLLTLLGAFMGIVLSQSMYIEWSIVPGYFAPSYPKMAIMYTIVVAAQMMGLPKGLVVFPVHLYRYLMRSKKDAVQAHELLSTTQKMPSVVGGNVLVYQESGVTVGIQAGRPDLAAAVRWAADMATFKDGTAAATTVVCAGPTPLNHAVHQLVLKQNRKAEVDDSKPYLCYQQETYEL